MIAALLGLATLLQQAPPRAMAITVDDLPVVSVLPRSVAQQETLTVRLLAGLARHRAPAAAFINEGKLYGADGALDPRRVALLEAGRAAGHELGNHTYSHPDLHRAALADFQADLLKGEQVTRALLARHGQAPRYFRHPFLHTGRSLEVRDSLLGFLAAHGYTVAPVTIDNGEYLYAAAYDRARARGDSATVERIRGDYLRYMVEVTAFYEDQARLIVGREFPQVLLLHANWLNADLLDPLLTLFEQRGYRFVPLAHALADPAYQSPDRYTGPAGLTWLHRWAITRDLPRGIFRGEPEVPDWIQAAAR